MNDHALLEVIDRIRGRYFGKYRGTVTEVDEATLRIKAKVPAVLGTQKTGWCTACLPYAGDQVGLAFLPEPGSGVWIEFEGGDVSYPIWVGCYWREGEKPSDVTPAVKAIVTRQGMKVLFDDDEQTIVLTDQSNNKVTLAVDSITLERGANKVVLNEAGVTVNDGALQVV